MGNAIEIIQVQGSDYDCGHQAGSLLQESIQVYLRTVQNKLPTTVNWEDIQNHAWQYYPASTQHFPYLIQNMNGLAEGSGLPFRDIFTLSVEEVFDGLPDHCTDVVISKPNPIIAHNNDSVRDHAPLVTAVKSTTVRGTVLSVGLGTFMSIGVAQRPNGYVVALSGNELYSKDRRDAGVPRLLVAHAILYEAENLTQAKKIANHPDRASSYNNIIADRNDVLCIEGSATDQQIIYPDKYAHYVHTNHYIHPKMTKYEAAPNHVSSMSRYVRALELSYLISHEQPIIPQLKKIMRDHGSENTPSDKTICKHDGEIFNLTRSFQRLSI